MLQFQAVLGLITFPLLAWLICAPANRLGPMPALRLVGVGIGLQFLIAALFLLIPQLTIVFDLLARGVAALQAATKEGMVMVFGYLAGGPAPFEITNPQHGFVLATQALPLILLMSVLSKLLYHYGILQKVVGFFAWCLEKTLGVSGALGTATAANIFVGMVEAPLLVRPYIAGMSRGALFAVMTTGMATVAGTVLALYASLLQNQVPGAAGHVLIASVMSAPAAIIIAKLMVPWADMGAEGDEDEAGQAASNEAADAPVSARDASEQEEKGGAMNAIAEGTSDGLRLIAYVAAMMVVMVSLVALINMVLGLVSFDGGFKLTVEAVFGWIAAPLAWLTGIAWAEAPAAGELIGIKTVLNEFIAFVKLSAVPDGAMSERTRTILTYVMCGFANPGSLGIMAGGLIAMAPERRRDIIALGPRSLIAGTLATLMTGAVIGVIS